MKHSAIMFRLAMTATVLAAAVPAAVAKMLVVEAASPRTNVFAGRAVTFGTVIRGGDVLEGRLVWALTISSRALASGAVAVRHEGDKTATPITINVPDIRTGVVVDATLTVALVDAAGKRLGINSRPVRIFPDDPFADRTRWLESRQIALVDPLGRTEEVFRAAGVPFVLVAADGDVSAIRSRLVVVGEGTSWSDHPKLPPSLTQLASRGVNVLCLAPLDGSMSLPGTGDEPGACVARYLVLRRADVVAEIDGRLDAVGWRDDPHSDDAVASRLTVAADGEEMVARVGETPTGWPWLEAAFARPEADAAAGKLVVCGWGVVACWDKTPAARYLFAALLERLADNQPLDDPTHTNLNHPASNHPQEKDR